VSELKGKESELQKVGKLEVKKSSFNELAVADEADEYVSTRSPSTEGKIFIIS
jgi:hypothetical protein